MCLALWVLGWGSESGHCGGWGADWGQKLGNEKGWPVWGWGAEEVGSARWMGNPAGASGGICRESEPSVTVQGVGP